MAENNTAGHEVHPIRGMESVIATVSGYHGTERFKLIKLIAQTGANFVGSMGRLTTHLVCWQFEGKKFDMARRQGTYVISHRWFEDCLKQGKRLPEDPYTMQSGEKVGSISWELPVIMDIHCKGKALLEKKKNVLSDLSNASDFSDEVGTSASRFNITFSNWSDSLHLNEPEDSSLSLQRRSSSNKRNFCDVSGINVTGEPVRRSRRLTKKSASDSPVDCVILDYRLRESHSPLKENNPVCVDLENLSSIIVPSAQELITATVSTVSEESRRDTLNANEDIEEQPNFHNSICSNSSRNCALTGPGTSQLEHYEHAQEKADLFGGGDNHNKERSRSDELGEASSLDSKTGLSCVICWTDFSSTRGVLSCGHRFCYSCIQQWADCMASKGIISTCPLCKTSFSHITKFETASDDQKIYSQTIPCGASDTEIYRLSSSRFGHHDTLPVDLACYVCHNREPEDLRVCCHICQERWVHSYCLDPPLIPWTCVCCSDLRLLYQRFH